MVDKGINIKDRDFILYSKARAHEPEILFLYKVRHKYKTGYKEYWFYAGTEIEEFLNKNNIEYVRNMIHPFLKPFVKDLEEIEILNNKLNLIKNNIDTITKKEILDIIENYTGFFGKGSGKE